MCKFKVGDKVVRLPPFNKGWPSGPFVVREVTKFNSLSLDDDVIRIEGDIHKYDSEYFELEDIYNSPLYQALL